MRGFILLVLLQVHAIFANTEKTIFLGPSPSQIPVQHPTLEDLQLQVISPRQLSLRTHIPAEFPTNTSKHGQSSWYILSDLHEGQRYEVRVCWAATQPTSFRLDTYELQSVFETPELITSLAQYSQPRQPAREAVQDQTLVVPNQVFDEVSSVLFLQIYAAADYYTMNQTLMKHVPPVYVDIILDPFLLNVFPQSLVPTAAYIVVVTIMAWFLSKYIATWIREIATDRSQDERKKL